MLPRGSPRRTVHPPLLASIGTSATLEETRPTDCASDRSRQARHDRPGVPAACAPHRTLPGALRSAAGWVLGWLVVLWVATLRVRRISYGSGARTAEGGARGGRVLAFLHGEQMGLLAARGLLAADSTVLVSRSTDGDLQEAVMAVLGFDVVRGSSSRGGATAVRGLLRSLRRGRDVAIAVDGPRGPRGVAKPGALAAARMGSAELVVVACAFSRAWSLRGSWDHFRIPVPFSRVVIGYTTMAPATADGPLLGSPRRGRPVASSSELTWLLGTLGEAARAALDSGEDSWHSRLADHVAQTGDD